MNYENIKNVQKIQEYVTNMRPAFNKRAVFSDETEDYRTPFEPEPGDLVHIKIRTKKNNVDMIYLVFEEQREVMQRVSSKDGFDYYEAVIPVGTETVRYYFEIYSQQQKYYLSDIQFFQELLSHKIRFSYKFTHFQFCT